MRLLGHVTSVVLASAALALAPSCGGDGEGPPQGGVTYDGGPETSSGVDASDGSSAGDGGGDDAAAPLGFQVVDKPLDAFLTDVWGFAASDVWVVGYEVDPVDKMTTKGVLLHFDGQSWTAVQRGEFPRLQGVWGLAPDDLWAVGTGCILHYDGATWSKRPENLGGSTPTSIHGASATDVWAVGGSVTSSGQTAYHFDGTTWTFVDLPMPTGAGGVWAASTTDAWAVGGRLQANEGATFGHLVDGTWENVGVGARRFYYGV